MLMITWTQLLYISLVLILLYVVEVFLFLYKQKKNAKELETKYTHIELVNLKEELEIIKVRVSALSASISSVANNVPENLKVNFSATSKEESAYAHAIRLAQKGADATELAAACGISRGEADLVVAIYRSSSERS